MPSTMKGHRSNVGGWLLVLCLYLTVVGPVLYGALMADRHASIAPRLVDAAVPYALLLATMLLGLAVTVYGIVAGLRLWRVEPGAPATARRALLAGLAVDIGCAGLDIALFAPTAEGGSFLRQVLVQTIPDLIAFTASLGYLQHSRRVRALFPDDAARR